MIGGAPPAGRRRAAAWAVAALLAASAGTARGAVPDGEAKVLLRLEAAFIAHSSDSDRIYAEEARFDLAGWRVASAYLKIDLAARRFLAYGGVTLERGNERRAADELVFDPKAGTGVLTTYGPEIRIETIDGCPAAAGSAAAAAACREALDEVTLAGIRSSLLYETARAVEITPGLEVYGYDVTFYVEGLESVGFRKIKLSLAPGARRHGLALEKLSFNRTQGLYGTVRYLYDRDGPVKSLNLARYEEHSILESYAGRPRQLDLQSSTTWALADRLSLGAAGDYNSAGIWNARFAFDRKPRPGRLGLGLDLAVDKTLGRETETWLGVRSSLDSPAWGALALDARYEVHDQTLANLTYGRALLGRTRVRLQSSYSQIRLGTGRAPSRIFTGNLTLGWDTDAFEIAADYFLNRDLVGNQRLARPQLRFGLIPLTFYGGLLKATFQNVFVYNDLRTGSGTVRTFNDNAAFGLSAVPVEVAPGLTVQTGLTVEQFLEKEGRHFTSGGAVFKTAADLLPGLRLEGFWSVQSRRKTAGWLIEGTTSQDLSGVLRLSPADRLDGWLSVSYDPKRGEWKQAFADLSVGLLKAWKLQALAMYDFYRGRLANIEVYLVRNAGRFDLRLVWRSISGQVLIELVPRS